MALLTLGVGIQSAASEQRVLFLGDSLTAGYGLAQHEAYPALIQEKADREGIKIRVINGGLSGDTSAGALRRLSWYLKEPPDIFFLALGANDGLRGLPTEQLKDNLGAIIDRVREKNSDVKVVLAGITLPLNFGAEYISAFDAVFAEVAEEKGATFLPFLLKGVAGKREMNLPDKLHPSAAGHVVIAEEVWRILEPLLLSSR